MSTVEAKVVDWLADGEVGASSKTMAFWLTWQKKIQDGGHPYDPADFDRCLRLLEAAPELRAKLPEMAKVSRYWAALVAHWDDVERSHLDEVGLGWTKARNAPKTYALMQRVLYPTRGAA